MSVVYVCPVCGTPGASRQCCPICVQRRQYVTLRALPDPDTLVVAPLAQLRAGRVPRWTAPAFPQLMAALGGGFRADVALAVWGPPGVGKTTLALLLAVAHPPALLVSLEMGRDAMKGLADRMGVGQQAEVYVSDRSACTDVMADAEACVAQVVVCDSVSRMTTPETPVAGSGVAVSTAAVAMTAWAHATRRTVLLLCHATKDELMAGPRMVEHEVDVVVAMHPVPRQGPEGSVCRIEVGKNRHGPSGGQVWLSVRASACVEIPAPS